jgi:hypothetical protein
VFRWYFCSPAVTMSSLHRAAEKINQSNRRTSRFPRCSRTLLALGSQHRQESFEGRVDPKSPCRPTFFDFMYIRVAIWFVVAVSCWLSIYTRTFVSNKAGAAASHRHHASNVSMFSLSSLDELAARLLSGQNHSEACQMEFFGEGWGRHSLCTRNLPKKPCYFYSFGINRDYSFDVNLTEKWGCFGFAADPTVTHPALLHPRVTFHSLGASSLRHTFMFSTTMPALRLWLKHDRVAVLKMDCEGCEYALAGDILREDRQFFHHIDQFSVEIHYSRVWLNSTEELYSLATLLHLLKEADMQLIHVDITHCGPWDEAKGLLPDVESRGLLLKDGHCHNYLFARL